MRDMRRSSGTWLLAAVLLLSAASCAKKEDEFADTTSAIDSTLAMGDVPPEGLQSDTQYRSHAGGRHDLEPLTRDGTHDQDGTGR